LGGSYHGHQEREKGEHNKGQRATEPRILALTTAHGGSITKRRTLQNLFRGHITTAARDMGEDEEFFFVILGSIRESRKPLKVNPLPREFNGRKEALVVLKSEEGGTNPKYPFSPNRQN